MHMQAFEIQGERLSPKTRQFSSLRPDASKLVVPTWNWFVADCKNYFTLLRQAHVECAGFMRIPLRGLTGDSTGV